MADSLREPANKGRGTFVEKIFSRHLTSVNYLVYYWITGKRAGKNLRRKGLRRNGSTTGITTMGGTARRSALRDAARTLRGNEGALRLRCRSRGLHQDFEGD